MAGEMLDRYGRATVARVVAAFYADVLQSPRLGHYFNHVAMSGLVEHQSMFMAAVMGGPEAFDAGHINRVHANLGITNPDFEEMLGLLEARMLQAGIQRDDIQAVIEGYRHLEGDVVAAQEGR